MPLTPETKSAIHNYLLVEISRYVREGKAAEDPKDIKPFHARLLPALFDVPLSERSFSTRSGSWWQQIARLVGTQFHKTAVLGHRINGQIKPAALQHIDEIIRQLNTAGGGRKPSRSQDTAEVCTVQAPGGDSATEVADLFILTHDDRELYFEMKTTQPNKDTSKAMKRFILRVAAMRKGYPAIAYGATAYNPYGSEKPYKWSYALQFLEIGEDMLIGKDFWTLIGDESTYQELLEITEAVGLELSPAVDKALADYKNLGSALFLGAPEADRT
jgi:hypothetical protein